LNQVTAEEEKKLCRRGKVLEISHV